MIGNDIVDLQLADIQSNWQRKGFLNKVFTKSEQRIIYEAKNPFQMVWLLWSMKESAYKVHVQQHLKRFFSPLKLACSLLNDTNGFVIINEKKYLTTATINNKYIYAEATINKVKHKIFKDCFYIENPAAKNQSKVTYTNLRKAISETYKLPFKNLSIKKTNVGIPKIFLKSKALNIPFSITHHGNYGAISILNQK